jgi:hypothetical protein
MGLALRTFARLAVRMPASTQPRPLAQFSGMAATPTNLAIGSWGL